MASLVKFTPINGCYQDYSPSSYLLEIDSYKILLDCGLPAPDWNGKFNVDDSYLKTLKRIAKTVDAVLLSHGDLLHCGALPLIINDLNPNASIYATVPVHHMGLMTLYDTLQALEPFNSEPSWISLFNYDDIDLAFEKIQKLRYSQPVNLTNSIVISPLPAGHSLGGSMWRIRKPPSEDILYTSAFNHKKEDHLEGALFDAISRPSLMIVNSQQALAPAVVRKDRDASLFNSINATIKTGGSVLIPVDSALRVLELAFVIDSGWNDYIKSSLNHPVKAYLLTNQSYRTLEFAKGMLEWMSNTVMKVFDADRTNPFDFKHINLVHSPDEISLSTPSIVLASSESLDYGNSHNILQQFAKSSSNCILAALEPRPDSILASLLSSAKQSEINIKTWKKVPLEGEELAKFYAIEREEKERKAAEAAFAAFEKARREQGSDLSGDLVADDAVMGGEDDQNLSDLLERQIDDAATFRNIFWVDYRNDWMVRSNPNDPINHLLTTPESLSNYFLDVGTAKNRFQSFPVREISKTVNEYGEVVHASEFEAPEIISRTSKSSSNVLEKSSINKKVKDESSKLTIPFKWACKTVSVNVKCARKSIQGFSGLSDGRSLKTIISRINPRKLLVIGGSTDATGFLLNHYRMSSEGIEAHAPKMNETINVSSSLNLLSAIISEALLNQLRVSYSQDYEVAHLSAKVKFKETSQSEPQDMQTDTTSSDFTYELIPSSLSNIPVGPFIMIGDVKLSELRRLLSLNHSSIKAEFTSSGDLICNGKILVKKDQSSGELYLEGPLSVPLLEYSMILGKCLKINECKAVTGNDFKRLFDSVLNTIPHKRTEYGNSKIGLAISGGSDSMALAALASEYFGNDRIKAFVVDHQLKDFGVNENPNQVQTILGKMGIQSDILKLSWNNSPNGNISIVPGKLMMQSRENRYKVLFDACKRESIPLLLTGHNLEDDIVTMFYRISRMSGIDGLAGMRKVTTFPFTVPYSDSTFILRPFLSIPKYQLLKTCIERGIPWTHDHSNDDLSFRRNECLQALIDIQAENSSITTESLFNLLNSFKSHRKFVHQKVSEVFSESVILSKTSGDATLILNNSKIVKNNYLFNRVLTTLIQFSTVNPYPPKTASLNRIFKEVQKEYENYQSERNRSFPNIKLRVNDDLNSNEKYTVKRLGFLQHTLSGASVYALSKHDTRARLQSFEHKTGKKLLSGPALLIQREFPSKQELRKLNEIVHDFSVSKTFLWDNRIYLEISPKNLSTQGSLIFSIKPLTVSIVKEFEKLTRNNFSLRKNLYSYLGMTPGSHLHTIPVLYHLESGYMAIPTLSCYSDRDLFTFKFFNSCVSVYASKFLCDH